MKKDKKIIVSFRVNPEFFELINQKTEESKACFASRS